MFTSSPPSIRLSVLNRHPSADWQLDVDVKHFEVKNVKVQEMYSDDLSAVVSRGQSEAIFGLMDKNTFAHPDRIIPTQKQYTAKEWTSAKRTVRRHSWQFITFE